jgi:hypothetical protein
LPTDGDAVAAGSAPRHVLPKDLPGAIGQRDDQELDRLHAAVLAEQTLRCRRPCVSIQALDKLRVRIKVRGV